MGSVPAAPLRVLHVDTGIGYAGGQVALAGILRHLDRSRFESEVASPAESRLRTACSDLEIPWVELRAKSVHLTHRQAASLAPSLYSAIWLAVLLRRRKIDLVHANTFKAALVAAGACRALRCPLVFHDRIHLSHGVAGRAVAGLADRIVVVSRAVGSKYRGGAARKVRLVYDGIEADRYAPEGGVAPIGAAVGFLGRLCEEKGLATLVEAAGEVAEAVPDVRFVIGGAPFTRADAAYLDRVKARLDALGLRGRFAFAGYVDDVRDFLAGISVLALPSVNEPLGLVVLEAMAAGKPVVAFDIGGPRETIRAGVDGLVVPPGDAVAFGRALAEILGDRTRARRMGEQGRQRVAVDFSTAASVRCLEQVFLEVAPGQGRRVRPERGEGAR